VVVCSVIDNLVKGAAGQAVQNMNLMFGLEESLGLNNVALLP
jgi:N-acetyl-gamma-glutamyl-phosphate reductase